MLIHLYDGALQRHEIHMLQKYLVTLKTVREKAKHKTI